MSPTAVPIAARGVRDQARGWRRTCASAVLRGALALLGLTSFVVDATERASPDPLLGLRSALATDDHAAARALLVEDAELLLLDVDAPPRRVRCADRVVDELRSQAASAGDTGPAVRLRRGFTVGSLVVAAESLPRILGEPTRLAMYRLTPEHRIARSWLFPPASADVPSALPQIERYWQAWSGGAWQEVQRLHAPDIRFLELLGTETRPAGTLDERRRCYEDGFLLWRTRRVRGAHPNYGCSGGPVEIVQALAVGPRVVTVEKRWWATAAEDYSGRMFLYAADGAGVRRVYYVLSL